jgi:hypothetical protein
MRTRLLVLTIAASIGVCIALYQGWLTKAYDHVTTAALSREARIAIEIGCRGHDGRAARECRSMLKRVYLAGSLDPDKTLRSYCDSVKHARWGGSRPEAPAVCVQRYGGWGAS